MRTRIYAATIRKAAVICLATGFLAITPLYSLSVAGLPGSTWGEVTYDSNHFEGLGSQGYVSQGINWFNLPSGQKFVTYVSGTWRLRSNNRLYYNAWSPSAGAEIQGSFYRAGVEYSDTRYIDLHTTTKKMQAQVIWYKGWTLPTEGNTRILGIRLRAYPGDTWGEITRTFDKTEGAGTQGHVEQGVTIAMLPGEIPVNAMAKYYWRLRQYNKPYYNAYGPATGIELVKGPFTAGAEYFWQHYPQPSTQNNNAFFYLRWYYEWDLKK